MPKVEPLNVKRASTERRGRKSGSVRVVAVTSGKGGVGKTNVSVNLALALAQTDNDVLILDADLGLANIDVMLGLQPKFNLHEVLNGERSLDEVMMDGPGGIKIIPASSGVQAMAELTPVQHGGLIRAFSELSCNVDVLLVDTAAGISDTVVSFTRAAQEIVVVVCDEPASITDAYALIKLLNQEHGAYRFRILSNMVEGAQQGREVYEKIARVTDRFLDVALDYFGYVPHDDYLRKAVKRQRAVVEAYPRSKAAIAFKTLADKTRKWPTPTVAEGNLQFFVERLIQNNLQNVEVMP